MRAHTRGERLHLGFLSSGFLALLGGAYIDNVKNALLPVFTKELGLTLDQAGLFLTLSNVGSFVCTFLIGYALKYRSERSVTLLVCAAAVAVTSFSLLVTGSGGLFVLAGLMGGLGACLGTLTNILTMQGSTESVKGRLLTYSQMLGALAAIAGPLVLTAIGAIQFHWAWLIVASAPFFILMAIYALKVLPSRKQQLQEVPNPEKAARSARLTGWHGFIIVIFCFFVAGEGLSTAWMMMYIQKTLNYSTSESSRYLIWFLLLVAGTRFLAGTFVRSRSEPYVLVLTLLLGITFSGLGALGYAAALPFVGMTGPFFPLFLGRVCNRFPESWKQITVYVSLAMQVFIAVCHYAMGSLAEKWGLEKMFAVIPLLFTLTLLLMLFYLVREKRMLGAEHKKTAASTSVLSPVLPREVLVEA